MTLNTTRLTTLVALAWLAVCGSTTAEAQHSHGEPVPAAPAAATPEVVVLSPALLDLLRAEMREIGAGVQRLGPAIAAGDWATIHDTGTAIRASYLLERSLTPAQVEELERALPPGFRALDAEFHALAAALAAAADAHDAATAAARYADLLRGCAACHAAYAANRFPGFAPAASAATPEAKPAPVVADPRSAAVRQEECIGATPVEAAQWLYAHRDALYGPEGPMVSVMTRQLAAALRREQDCIRRTKGVCALDADLWTNAQEGVMLGPVEYEEAESGDTTAIVRVNYRYSPWEDGREAKPATTLVRLARDHARACWRLSDLIGAHGDSLRAQLATNR